MTGHTPSLISRLKRIVAALAVPVLVVFYPAAALAASTGPQSPTGADRSTYSYNEETGKWENDYYQWDPVTKQTTPKASSTYTHDPATNTWSTNEWQYDAPSGSYKAVPKPVPEPSTTSSTSTATGLNNQLTSTATSGDATVSHNTTAGDATSGSAVDIANVINILQSSLTASGSADTIATFNTTIAGDVNGTLYIDPSSIMQNQGNSSSLQSAGGLQVNSQNSGQIDNAILLNATSGQASVVGNTTAGSAQSGDAAAIANVVNFMNTAVAANQSFVGVLNIQGDLVGDILLPDGLLDSLIAANRQAALDGLGQSTTSNQQTITNNVTAIANSGDATVDHNTMAGDATSGSARSSLTVMNLTGSDIIGSNALLVFVNVLGTWTGLIVNTPGSTSALLGGGITTANSSTPSLTHTASASNDSAGSASGSTTNAASINNTVVAAATSGDATVSHNTTAGDATSGNATAVVNVANIVNSSLSLTSWFGILFINVLGDWFGSFGVNSTPPAASAPAENQNNPAPTFRFEPGQAAPIDNSRQTADVAPGSDQVLVNQASPEGQNAATLGAVSPSSHEPPEYSLPLTHHSNLLLPLISFTVGLLLLGSGKLSGLLRRG